MADVSQRQKQLRKTRHSSRERLALSDIVAISTQRIQQLNGGVPIPLEGEGITMHHVDPEGAAAIVASRGSKLQQQHHESLPIEKSGRPQRTATSSPQGRLRSTAPQAEPHHHHHHHHRSQRHTEDSTAAAAERHRPHRSTTTTKGDSAAIGDALRDEKRDRRRRLSGSPPISILDGGESPTSPSRPNGGVETAESTRRYVTALESEIERLVQQYQEVMHVLWRSAGRQSEHRIGAEESDGRRAIVEAESGLRSELIVHGLYRPMRIEVAVLGGRLRNTGSTAEPPLIPAPVAVTTQAYLLSDLRSLMEAQHSQTKSQIVNSETFLRSVVESQSSSVQHTVVRGHESLLRKVDSLSEAQETAIAEQRSLSRENGQTQSAISQNVAELTGVIHALQSQLDDTSSSVRQLALQDGQSTTRLHDLLTQQITAIEKNLESRLASLLTQRQLESHSSKQQMNFAETLTKTSESLTSQLRDQWTAAQTHMQSLEKAVMSDKTKSDEDVARQLEKMHGSLKGGFQAVESSVQDLCRMVAEQQRGMVAAAHHQEQQQKQTNAAAASSQLLQVEQTKQAAQAAAKLTASHMAWLEASFLPQWSAAVSSAQEQKLSLYHQCVINSMRQLRQAASSSPTPLPVALPPPAQTPPMSVQSTQTEPLPASSISAPQTTVSSLQQQSTQRDLDNVTLRCRLLEEERDAALRQTELLFHQKKELQQQVQTLQQQANAQRQQPNNNEEHATAATTTGGLAPSSHTEGPTGVLTAEAPSASKYASFSKPYVPQTYDPHQCAPVRLRSMTDLVGLSPNPDPSDDHHHPYRSSTSMLPQGGGGSAGGSGAEHYSTPNRGAASQSLNASSTQRRRVSRDVLVPFSSVEADVVSESTAANAAAPGGDSARANARSAQWAPRSVTYHPTESGLLFQSNVSYPHAHSTFTGGGLHVEGVSYSHEGSDSVASHYSVRGHGGMAASDRSSSPSIAEIGFPSLSQVVPLSPMPAVSMHPPMIPPPVAELTTVSSTQNNNPTNKLFPPVVAAAAAAGKVRSKSSSSSLSSLALDDDEEDLQMNRSSSHKHKRGGDARPQATESKTGITAVTSSAPAVNHNTNTNNNNNNNNNNNKETKVAYSAFDEDEDADSPIKGGRQSEHRRSSASPTAVSLSTTKKPSSTSADAHGDEDLLLSALNPKNATKKRALPTW